MLKKDTISITIIPQECKPTTLDPTKTFSSDVIDLIRDYEPKVYFPDVIFTGPHLLEGFDCGGTYTQTIRLRDPVFGASITEAGGPILRPFLEILATTSLTEPIFVEFVGSYVDKNGQNLIE